MKQPRHAVKYTLAVLLLAALTTTEILSATYAKYIISSDPVSDSARVALYEVTVNGSADDVNLDAAGDKNISGDPITEEKALVTKAYQIVNNSEVAVSYKFIVTLDKALPAGTSLQLFDGTNTVTLAESTADENAPIKVKKAEDAISYTCSSSAWALAPGAGDPGAHTITLTFTTDNGDSAAVTDLTGIGVTVKVVATQID